MGPSEAQEGIAKGRRRCGLGARGSAHGRVLSAARAEPCELRTTRCLREDVAGAGAGAGADTASRKFRGQRTVSPGREF